MERETIFSDDRKYRYTLWREWLPKDNPLWPLALPINQNWPKYVQFIGLNPSTADETQDDPTIRRCIGYAKAWGYGALCMTNLFALRATDPDVMLDHESPIAETVGRNDDYIIEIAKSAGLVVCAWGNHGIHMLRGPAIINGLNRNGIKIHCLKKTSSGDPSHPLYLKKDLTPIPYP